MRLAMTRTTRPAAAKEGRQRKESPAARLDALIEEATVDANDESEQKTGFYTMLERGPLLLRGRMDRVTCEKSAEGGRACLDPREPASPVERRRVDAARGEVDDGLDLLTVKPLIPFQDVVNIRTRFEVFENGSDRHARAAKYPRAADLTRHTLHHRALRPVQGRHCGCFVSGQSVLEQLLPRASGFRREVVQLFLEPRGEMHVHRVQGRDSRGSCQFCLMRCSNRRTFALAENLAVTGRHARP